LRQWAFDVEDTEVRGNAFGKPLTPVKVDGVVSREPPLKARETVHDSRECQEEKRTQKSVAVQ
jgi:hypothetical protein